MKDKATKLEKFTQLDNKLVEVARGIKILSVLGWDASHSEAFLKSWKAKKPKLPKVEYPRFIFKDQRHVLQNIAKQCKEDHPIANYLNQTAKAYIAATLMLENIGSPVFQEMSEILYGTPKDRLGSGSLTNLDAADNFIEVTSDFALSNEQNVEDSGVTPQEVASELSKTAKQHFPGHEIAIVIDEHLSSKAAAGGKRIRLRGLTSFTNGDIQQLIQHELLVHSATMLNGLEQPNLKSMGLGSPRTTSTQEGIATFAELITSTMDLSRLRRIALRIKGINIAYEGGDFLDVFKFFLESGQSEQESFQSTARVFRGGKVQGGVIFTKDNVYLKGLISVHTFLRKSAQMRKINYPKFLFIGRIALGDIISLEPYIDSGYISPPVYQAPWVANREGLAAYLSYAVFANQLNLGKINLADFIEKLPDDLHEDADLSTIG